MNHWPAIVSALLASLLLVGACSGDDGGDGDGPTGASPGATGPAPTQGGPTPSPEDIEYFETLSSALAAITAEGQDLNEFRAGAFDPDLPESQRIENAREFAARYDMFARGGHAALLEIPPGPSLGGQHGALVDAMNGLIRLAGEMAAALDETPVATEDGFRSLFFDLDGQSLELRVRDACFDLQNFAASHGIQVELTCPR